MGDVYNKIKNILKRRIIMKTELQNQNSKKNQKMINVQENLLIVNVLQEMELNGKLSKSTFRSMVVRYGVKIKDFVEYLYANKKDYWGDEASVYHMFGKGTKKPTKDISKWLIKYCKDEKEMPKRISAKQLLELRQYPRECEVDDESEEPDVRDIWKEILDDKLTDEKISILYNSREIIFQFNNYLWDTIKKVENCGEEQRERIRKKFKRQSKLLQEKEPKLREALKFKWENTIMSKKDRLQKLVEIVDDIRLEDDSTWLVGYIDVFANLTQEDWELVRRILLNEYYPKSPNFSTRVNRKLEECFAD